MKWRGPKAWLLWFLFVECLILLVSLRAYYPTSGQRRAGREGNTIARLVLDDPGRWESIALYVGLTHVLVGVLFVVAHLSARRKARRAATRETDG